MRNYIAHPHHVLTDSELSDALGMVETEIRLRWDQDAYAARCEEDANIEEALAQRKLEDQP